MKLAAVLLIFKDQHFIPACFAAIYPEVDMICCVTAYDRNLKGTPISPDKTVETLLSLPDPENKLRLSIIRNTDGLPGQDEAARLRNAAMKSAPDADYFLIVDTDEIHSTEVLRKSWKQVQATQWAGYRMLSYTYFKNWNCCIEPNEGYSPLVYLRQGFFFKKDRQVQWRSLARYKEYLRKGRKPKMIKFSDDIYFHHGAYVGDDERILTKIKNWSHADEIVPNWYEDKWKNFSSKSTDLHPCHAPVYQGVKNISTKDLPKEITAFTWPNGWLNKE